jgi:protein-L-isoaspartate(D-aspartate) O-methyltransferase
MNWLGPAWAYTLAGSILASCGGVPGHVSRTEEDWAAERARMVREQLAAPDRDIRDPAVLRVMGRVPRHRFVPPEVVSAAYADGPLPIGYGQTISQPYVVAFMTEQLALRPTDRVLEIGTGSGYQAAVLAELAAEVYTIEIVAPLAEQARSTLADLGYQNIHARTGDGYLGWPEAAPFDAVIVTCAPERIPPALIEQLKDGGRLIIPVGPAYDQQLVLLRKRAGRVRQEAVLPVRFVPMLGRAATE